METSKEYIKKNLIELQKKRDAIAKAQRDEEIEKIKSLILKDGVEAALDYMIAKTLSNLTERIRRLELRMDYLESCMHKLLE